jgi:hypothetical protein
MRRVSEGDWDMGTQGYAWAEDKEHCEEYGRMLAADPRKVSARAKKRGLPQVCLPLPGPAQPCPGPCPAMPGPLPGAARPLHALCACPAQASAPPCFRSCRAAAEVWRRTWGYAACRHGGMRDGRCVEGWIFCVCLF